MAEIKRHFYNGKDYILDEENKVVRLSEEFHKKLLEKKLWGKFGFKKIGGSSIGNIVCKGMFYSEFDAFCKMSWIGLPVLDPKYVDAGVKIEPIAIEEIRRQLPLMGGKPELVPIKAEDYEYDYFKDKDDVIGGVPDALIKVDGKEIIVEIKTTGKKNWDNWAKFGMPESYHKQAMLYALLNGSERYFFGIAFLDEQDYVHPEKIKLAPKVNFQIKSFPVDKEKILQDFNYVKSWHAKYTKSAVSPSYSEADKDTVEWLRCHSKDEWEDLKEKWINEGKIKI